MKLSDGIIPHTPEWHAARNGKITSSLMHKIFVKGTGGDLVGAGGMTYINQKIAEILTDSLADELQDDRNIPDDIQRGLANEPWAIERFTDITGIKVYESRLFEYNAIAAGTTDGQESKDGVNVTGIVEAKCPRAWKHLKICAVDSAQELKLIDPQYYHQPQSNIFFTGAEHCDFISYNDEIKVYDLQIRIVRIYPEMRWQKECVDKIDWIADYMNSQLTKILQTKERNLQYKIEDKEEKIDKLKTAIESIRSI